MMEYRSKRGLTRLPIIPLFLLSTRCKLPVDGYFGFFPKQVHFLRGKGCQGFRRDAVAQVQRARPVRLQGEDLLDLDAPAEGERGQQQGDGVP